MARKNPRVERLLNTSPIQRIIEGDLMPRKRKNPSLTRKFDKSVDSGPLPMEADVEMQKTIQKERVRRQIRSHMGAKKY